MQTVALATRIGLTTLARGLRCAAHLGIWLVEAAERGEATLDTLAARTGLTVEAVYAPLRRNAR